MDLEEDVNKKIYYIISYEKCTKKGNLGYQFLLQQIYCCELHTHSSEVAEIFFFQKPKKDNQLYVQVYNL